VLSGSIEDFPAHAILLFVVLLGGWLLQLVGGSAGVLEAGKRQQLFIGFRGIEPTYYRTFELLLLGLACGAQPFHPVEPLLDRHELLFVAFEFLTYFSLHGLLEQIKALSVVVFCFCKSLRRAVALHLQSVIEVIYLFLEPPLVRGLMVVE